MARTPGSNCAKHRLSHTTMQAWWRSNYVAGSKELEKLGVSHSRDPGPVLRSLSCLPRERGFFCFLAWKNEKSPEGFRAVWRLSSFERSRAPFKSLRFSLFCLSYVLFLVASMILFLRLLMYRSMKTVLLSARSGNQSSLRSFIAYSERSQNSLMSFVSM